MTTHSASLLRPARALLGAASASALLLTTSCFTHRKAGQSPGAHLAAAIEASYQIERHCCNPFQPLPLRVGTLVLRNKNAPGSDTPPVHVEVTAGGSLQTDQRAIALAAGESATIAVDTTGCAYDTDAVTVALTYGSERRVDAVPVRNLCSPAVPLLVALNLVSREVARAFLPAFRLAAVDRPVLHSSRLVAARPPQWLQTEIAAIGIFALVLTAAQIHAVFGGPLAADGVPFPPGLGANGLTLVAERPMPMPEGGYHVAFLDAEGEIPVADPTRRYQYAFVFDADGRADNDYRPSPDFPNDFFQGTDRWYEVGYEPGTGWKLRCKRVDAGNRVTEVGSAARAVIVKDGVFLLAPQNEFAVASPRYRVTAFGHEGDFGLRPPHAWSGDVEPPVAEGLHAY